MCQHTGCNLLQRYVLHKALIKFLDRLVARENFHAHSVLGLLVGPTDAFNFCEQFVDLVPVASELVAIAGVESKQARVQVVLREQVLLPEDHLEQIARLYNAQLAIETMGADAVRISIVEVEFNQGTQPNVVLCELLLCQWFEKVYIRNRIV